MSKRLLDDKVKATQSCRKLVDSDCKSVEKLVKSFSEKTKPKLEPAVKNICEHYTGLKLAQKDLEALEDDKKKDFQKKKDAELALCQKSLDNVKSLLENVKEKTEFEEELQSTLNGIVGDGDQEESKAEDADQSESAKETEEGKTEASEADQSEEVSEKLEDGEYDADDDVEEDLEDTNTQADTEVDKNQGESYEVQMSFAGDQPGDLIIHKGESVQITSKREDGWWEGVNAKGEKGLVPSNYLKRSESAPKGASSTKGVKEDNAGETEYDEYEDDEDEEEESEYEDDDDDDEEYESSGDDKEAPAAAVEKESEATDTKKTSVTRWGSLRKQMQKTSAADVVAAFGGGPTGFRDSTCAKLLQPENGTYSYVKALHPKISDSGFQLEDLFWDDSQKNIRARETKVLRTFRLVIARNIPLPAEGCEVLCRYVNISLFDGEKILGNIITVKASWSENDSKTWKFSPKTSGLLPMLLDGFGLLRYPEYKMNLGLLIEFNIAVHRPKSGVKGTISCGHVHFKLCSDYGNSVAVGNKEFEVSIMGGTPYEKDIPLDPSTTGDQTGGSTASGSGGLRALSSSKKQATLTIKMGELTKEERQQASHLPETLVLPVCALQFVVFYRQCLATELLQSRTDKSSMKAISSPFLANFPIAMNTPDLVDLVRNEWAEVFKSMKRNEKKDAEVLRNAFKNLFLKSVYPLMYSYALPKFALNDQESQSERWRLMKELSADMKKTPLCLLTSSSIQHKPFLLRETTVDVISPFYASSTYTSSSPLITASS